MNVSRTTIYTVLASLIFGSTLAFAVKMDETTHDMVIERLEIGLDGMEKNDPERNEILLRLGDLLADRARLKAMNEMQENCKDCHKSRGDRDKAIALYNEALTKTEKSRQGQYVLQIAHLYALNDQSNKSTTLYNQIVKSKPGAFSSEVRAIAFSSLGDIKFRQSDFKGALSDYQNARRENIKNKALIEFRMAWCKLNLGQTEQATQALIRLLKNPDLLATQTADGKSVDPTFVQDVSHDLAIFLARGTVGPKQIRTLKELSPESARKTNLHTLATETDRLGKKEAALIVWANYVDEGSVQANEKLEVQTRVAQIYYDMNRQDLAANAFEKATDFWKKLNCTDPNLCDELKTRMRKFVTAWNKAQKNKPTQNLLRIYLAYTSTFPADTEMLHWGAIVAKDMNRPKEAGALFHQAALQAHGELQKNPAQKEMRNIFEGSLLAEIEMAEARKDLKAREDAYNFYLQYNPNGGKAFEVRYQRAQVFYSSNRFQEAFSEFHYLATMPGKEHRDLKIKSADLALDSLASLKDDKSIQVRSLEYARLFPERKTEYLKISRKATMTIVAANLKNDKETNRADYKANLAALAAVDMNGADDSEKIKFYKNKIVIAQKALELDVVKDSSDKLLRIRSLSADDKEWALAQKIWVAQLELNFAEAYRLSLQMKHAELSKADRELRLAMLAELAGKSPKKHNEQYLKIAGQTRAANMIRVSLIRESSQPWREIDKHLLALKKTPDLLAGITLEVFAEHRDLRKAERILKTTNIGRFAAGQTLQRQFDLKDFYAFDQKIRSHRIFGYSDLALQKTLKERLKLLAENEKRAQIAFRKKDWTLQVINLAQLARENRRLYHEILQLPVPKRLNAQEKLQYQELLKKQSEPYLTRADKIDNELNQVWSNGSSLQNLQAAYMSATPELQKIYRDEITPLAKNAPAFAKDRLQNLLNTPYRRPRQKDILMARRELQVDPFNIEKAEKLRELESQGGHAAMVVYLDERISQLKKGSSL